MNRKKELFTILQEECGEIVQAVSKVLRFGEESFSPKDRSKTPNIQNLELEIADFLAVMKFLLEEGHVDGERIMDASEAKFKKLEKFIQHKL